MSKYRITVYQDKSTGYWVVEIDIDGTNIGVVGTQAEAIAYAERKRG